MLGDEQGAMGRYLTVTAMMARIKYKFVFGNCSYLNLPQFKICLVIQYQDWISLLRHFSHFFTASYQLHSNPQGTSIKLSTPCALECQPRALPPDKFTPFGTACNLTSTHITSSCSTRLQKLISPKDNRPLYPLLLFCEEIDTFNSCIVRIILVKSIQTRYTYRRQ